MNDIQIKTFIYWLALVIISFTVDNINRSINGKSFSDKGWSDYSNTHALKMLLLYAGLITIAIVIFYKLTEWWINYKL